MSYFNNEFYKFFDDLDKNNNKNWFDKNRKIYENLIKKPFADFVEEMIIRIQKYEPELQLTSAQASLRINNDIRFAKDKPPYKTYVAANISSHGKDISFPGFFFKLSPQKIEIYGGVYMVDKEKLQKIRKYISENLDEFRSVYNDKDFKEKYGKLQGEKYKRLPIDIQAIEKDEPLIANKNFYYGAGLNPKLIMENNLPELLMEYYVAGIPVNDFLKKAIK